MCISEVLLITRYLLFSYLLPLSFSRYFSVTSVFMQVILQQITNMNINKQYSYMAVYFLSPMKLLGIALITIVISSFSSTIYNGIHIKLSINLQVAG